MWIEDAHKISYLFCVLGWFDLHELVSLVCLSSSPGPFLAFVPCWMGLGDDARIYSIISNLIFINCFTIASSRLDAGFSGDIFCCLSDHLCGSCGPHHTRPDWCLTAPPTGSLHSGDHHNWSSDDQRCPLPLSLQTITRISLDLQHCSWKIHRLLDCQIGRYAARRYHAQVCVH